MMVTSTKAKRKFQTFSPKWEEFFGHSLLMLKSVSEILIHNHVAAHIRVDLPTFLTGAELTVTMVTVNRSRTNTAALMLTTVGSQVNMKQTSNCACWTVTISVVVQIAEPEGGFLPKKQQLTARYVNLCADQCKTYLMSMARLSVWFPFYWSEMEILSDSQLTPGKRTKIPQSRPQWFEHRTRDSWRIKPCQTVGTKKRACTFLKILNMIGRQTNNTKVAITSLLNYNWKEFEIHGKKFQLFTIHQCIKIHFSAYLSHLQRSWHTT